MTNADIRKEMYARGIPQWKLAKLLGISEMSVWRLLRDELPEEKREEILRLLEGCADD